MKIKEKWSYKIEVENKDWYKKYKKEIWDISVYLKEKWIMKFCWFCFGVWVNYNSQAWLGVKS